MKKCKKLFSVFIEVAKTHDEARNMEMYRSGKNLKKHMNKWWK